MHRAGAPLALLAGATLVLLAATTAPAQPYAADGGFDRPRQLLTSLDRPALAVAIDRGAAMLLRIEGDRVLLAPLTGDAGEAAAPTLLARGTQLRDVVAGGSRDGDAAAAYAWYGRDVTTGRYTYTWHSEGETRTLFESPQIVEVRVAVGPEGPEAFVARPHAAGAAVERWRWRDGEEAVPGIVLTSELRLAGLDVAYDHEGGLHLAYLEGFTETTDVGVASEWAAYYLAPGAALPSRLGPAAPPPQRVVLDLRGDMALAWTRDDGRVVASLGAGAPGTEYAPDSGAELGAGRSAHHVVLGSGAAVAATEDRLIWSSGASLRSLPRPPEGQAPVNLAWSPLTIERAFAVRDAGGTTHLVWLGTRAGHGFGLLASDDRRPMERTLGDRLAATLRWSPWSLAEEALGQAAGALLAGAVLTIALLPLFWTAAVIAVRHVRHERARLAGGLLAAAPILLALLLVAGRATLPRAEAWALVGAPFVTPVALLLGVLAGTVALRRVDAESLATVVLSASVTCFVVTTLIAFATFQHWLVVFGARPPTTVP